MEFTGKFAGAMRDISRNKVVISFEVNEESALKDIDKISQLEKLKIKATKFREKRSLDANAYLWVLLHKLAGRTLIPAEDLYKRYISQFGRCEVVRIQANAIKDFCDIWESRGIGWLTENMGPVTSDPRFYDIKCFYGSKTYDSCEMATLIDAAVEDCKTMGIDTLTPSEIERLKALWESQS